MEHDWQHFSAFKDTLSASIFMHSTTEEGVEKFYSWLDGVLHDPSAYGISQVYSGDVKAIQDRFAVYDNGGNLTLEPLVEHIIAGSVTPEPFPVTVHFGLQRQPIELIDAAAALGYIFSIVSHPHDATWHSYWVPLLVLYSRCLYLAFVVKHENQEIAVSGVPIMANVMYLADAEQFHQSSRPAMFGASIPAPPRLHTKYAGNEDNREKLVRARTWRRGQVLLTGLHRAIGTDAQLPLTKQDLERLQETLSVLITKAPAPVKEGKERPPEDPVPEKRPFSDDFFLSTKDIEEEIKKRTDRGAAVPFKTLISTAGTEKTLRELLSRLFTRRYEVQASVSTDAELNATFKEVLEYYITPHVWPVGIRKVDPKMKIVLLQSEQDRITQIVSDLWETSDLKEKAHAKLDYAIKRQVVNNDPKSQSNSGHCAETYPVVGVGQYYFPSPKNHAQYIKGFTMEVRAIGNTELFSRNGFSLATLQKVPVKYIGHNNFNSACRYPCGNCRAVLTLFGVPASVNDGQLANYDQDLHEANVQPR